MNYSSDLHEDIPLRVLLVEDSQQDAELILLFLGRGGFVPAWHRVETEEDMRSELSQFEWDVILSDYTMPHFSGDRALDVANELAPDIPLIVVSGNIGEEQTVSLLRDGARDYVMKSNLSRLVPSISRELEEARLRVESRQMNEILDNVTGVLLPLTGDLFFETIVKTISDSLGVKHVEICSIDTSPLLARTVARFQDEKIIATSEYPLAEAFYTSLQNKNSLFIDTDIEKALNKLGIDLNIGSDCEFLIVSALRSASGGVIGMLTVSDNKPASNLHAINSIIKLCSVRIVAELDRLTNERQLERSEKQMRDILRNMQDTLFRIDQDNNVQWVTPSVTELIGFNPDEVVGMPYDSFFSSGTQVTDLRASLDSSDGRISGIEMALRHRNGSVVWLSVNAQYFYDENNAVAGIEGVARNITQQRLAEIALRQSEELFSKAFHASPAMVAISSVNDDYSFSGLMSINDTFRKNLGYTHDELMNTSFSDINFFHNESDMNEIVSLLKSQGYGRDIEFPYRTKIDQTRYALGSIDLVDIAGEICALSVFQDVTDRRNAQKELEDYREHLEELVEQRTKELSEAVNNLEVEVNERRNIEQALVEATTRAQAASKAKSEFLANMSHELRTPLNSIIGFSELLLLEPEDVIDEDSREKLSYVLDSAWHLLSLINDILDLSKIEAGKMELDISEIHLDSVMASIQSLFKEKFDKQAVHMKTVNLAEGEVVVADDRKLKQVMFNLVSNAVKFTPEQGTVTIKFAMATLEEFESLCGCPEAIEGAYSRFLSVSVQDTGIGIEKDDCKKLFMPFKQVDSSVTRKYEGTGLGLHLCRQMVELHGGCIDVESEPGKGSCFHFIIPCGPRQA